MATVFCCGFECGTTNTTDVGQHWVLGGAAATMQTSFPRSGLRCLRLNPSAVGTGYATKALTAGRTFTMHAYCGWVSAPIADASLFAIGNAGGTRYPGVAFKASDGKLYAWSGTAYGATGLTLPLGVQLRFDVKIDTSANPWTVDAQITDTTTGITTTLGQATNAEAAADVLNLLIGTGATSTYDVYWDDVKVDNSTAAYPMADSMILGFVPNADGTHTSTGTNIVKGTIAAPTTGGAITVATTDAYQRVDGRPILGGSADNTRLINQQTLSAAQYVEVAFQDATGAPNCLDVITADREASTATCNFQTKLNDNGTEDAIANRGTVAGVTTDRYVRKHYAAMVGGGAWTLDRFNNLKARFGYSSDATPDVYWRGIMIEADFPQKSLVFDHAAPGRVALMSR